MLSQSLGERVELTGSMVSKTAESDHDRQTPPHLASRVFPASILSKSGAPCLCRPKACQKGGSQQFWDDWKEVPYCAPTKVWVCDVIDRFAARSGAVSGRVAEMTFTVFTTQSACNG